jgi:RHS repeat-associated protein
MPGRKFNSGNYRFGFNGKEKNPEIDGGNYDFGARYYDSRIGRWWSVDPLEHIYPSTSTYSTSLNNPIKFIDTDGRFVVDPYIEENYPKIAAYLKATANDWKSGKKGVITELLFSSALVNNLIQNSAHFNRGELTLLTEEDIRKAVYENSGPEIKVSHDLHLDKPTSFEAKGVLYISEQKLKALENAITYEQAEGYLLSVVNVIFHEYLEQFVDDHGPHPTNPNLVIGARIFGEQTFGHYPYTPEDGILAAKTKRGERPLFYEDVWSDDEDPILLERNPVYAKTDWSVIPTVSWMKKTKKTSEIATLKATQITSEGKANVELD